MDRRDSLKLLALAPLAGLPFTPADAERAHAAARQKAAALPAGRAAPDFFTPHEYATLERLVDHIIPADDRSGSATDAGVPAFIDFMMLDRPQLQVPFRGGLAWLDAESRRRAGARFIDAAPEAQMALLDAIAYPAAAPDHLRPGVAFFTLARDMTATGFWTSPMGIEDLQYMGNQHVARWTGAPPEVLDRLGVSYDDWDARYAHLWDG